MTPFARAAFGVLPAWRGLCTPGLPFWSFFGRKRVTRLQALQAEERCAACTLQPRCLPLVAARTPALPEGCPNKQLLA
jgi:hypothetical protein